MISQCILPLLIYYCDSNNHVNIYKSSWGDKDPYYVGKFQWQRATTAQRAASSFPGPKMFQEEVGKKDFLEAFTGRCESLVLWAARQRKKKRVYSPTGVRTGREGTGCFSAVWACSVTFIFTVGCSMRTWLRSPHWWEGRTGSWFAGATQGGLRKGRNVIEVGWGQGEHSQLWVFLGAQKHVNGYGSPSLPAPAYTHQDLSLSDSY